MNISAETTQALPGYADAAAHPQQAKPTGPGVLSQQLGLWDATSIIVGIVVGTAIFRSPTLVFQAVAGPWEALAIWLIGGIVCLCGAFCYAELATTYPRNGGDYEYLGRAYGRGMGFLFGWAQLAVILTGSIGAMAYAFADYGARLWNLPENSAALIAAAAVVALTLVNLFGVVAGKALQNVLSMAKVVGLVGIIVAGVVWGRGDHLSLPGSGTGLSGAGLGLALVFVLYAYGGWNDAVFVAAEVRDGRRNMPRAMILGIAAITVIYLAVNVAYLAVLGFDAARATDTPAADVLERAIGPWGGKAITLLVMVSALGAINGMILAGSHVYATVGEDHRIFAVLSRCNPKLGAPVAALVGQAGIALLLILAVGTVRGQGTIDVLLTSLALPALPWEQYFGGFETLVTGTAPVFWGFFLLSGLSLFVLRLRDGDRERPFKTPGFPFTPLVFCCTCAYMLYSSIAYARLLSLLGLVPLAIGVPLYWLSRRATILNPESRRCEPSIRANEPR